MVKLPHPLPPPPTPSRLDSWEGSHCVQPTFKGRELNMKIVWNSSSWEMYLLLSVWVHGHLSNGLCYNSVLHFLFWCSACSGFGSSFGCFLCPFDTPANRGMFFCLLICFLSSFFLSDTKRCSRLIFYISCPSLRISCFLRSPPSVFYLLFVRVYKASVFW